MPVVASSSPVLDISGIPVIGRIVRVYRRDTGDLLVAGVTDSGGMYSLTTSHTGAVNVVCLDPTEDYADKILRTTPV